MVVVDPAVVAKSVVVAQAAAAKPVPRHLPKPDLVLEEGRVVGRGTHEELLVSSQTYREIVDSQITVGEPA